jgi:hypothetical protein
MPSIVFRRSARGRPPRDDGEYFGSKDSSARQNASPIRQLDPRNPFFIAVTSVPL